MGRNLELAQKAAKEIGQKGIAVQADGTDEQALTSLLAGHDILMNAAFDDVNLPAIRAAIRPGHTTATQMLPSNRHYSLPLKPRLLAFPRLSPTASHLVSAI